MFICCLFACVSGVYRDRVSVSVMEGDSVTLHTGVQTNQQEYIKWYFSGLRIAQISGDLSDICTDVQCNVGTERFRDRLQLDNQTGSLAITNITTTHSGLYKLVVLSSRSDSEMMFAVSVTGESFNECLNAVYICLKYKILQQLLVCVSGVSAAERDEMKEGESVTLDPGVTKHPNDVMTITWYFNDTRITQITGNLSKICRDDHCKERFRDRLKLDSQTGSLTIMNTRTTNSGLYNLKIIHSIRHRHSISIISIKRFSITVIGECNFGSLFNFAFVGDAPLAAVLPKNNKCRPLVIMIVCLYHYRFKYAFRSNSWNMCCCCCCCWCWCDSGCNCNLCKVLVLQEGPKEH
uniref:Immunoglobulin domain-containing protein n=1 Tax=Sinocyclocheilus rhinocerous TaxID=307959 RepID=A0A673MMI9_9TELE